MSTIIKNFTELARDRKTLNALNILEAGLYAASPKLSIEKYLKKNKIIIKKSKQEKIINLLDYSNVYIVAFGKAADSMTKTANRILNIKSGFVVIPKKSRSITRAKKFTIFNTSHPVPDQTSVKAARTIIKFLKERKKTEFVLFLISGGGSSLLCLPDSISLSDKKYVNDILLKSGATIDEFNCVRKHLSKIKGGRLVEDLSCDAISLVMSDVVGNNLSSIASGTTYCDHTSFSDAIGIIKKYNLIKKIPDDAYKRLVLGKQGIIPETPKKPKIINQIIATNTDCLEAMRKKAIEIGYKPKIIHIKNYVINDAARKIIKAIDEHPKTCVLFGGESVVKVVGKGKGGRNQELVLQILQHIQHKNKKIVIASVGTDGIDGNTIAAGAIIKKSKIDMHEIKSFLDDNNSNTFFHKYGGLIYTGYTHTNLMDIGLVIS